MARFSRDQLGGNEVTIIGLTVALHTITNSFCDADLQPLLNPNYGISRHVIEKFADCCNSSIILLQKRKDDSTFTQQMVLA